MCKIINIICADTSRRKDVLRWIRAQTRSLIEESYDDDPNMVKKYLKEMSRADFNSMITEIIPELATVLETVTLKQEQMTKVYHSLFFSVSFLFTYRL